MGITLPPLFYEPSFLSKLSNSLYRKGFTLAKSDLNYSIHLDGEKENYQGKLHYNARKNLNIAMEQSFTFEHCNNAESKSEAYKIIQANREAKGYPLRMTYDTVVKTTAIIQADFFLVKLAKENVAAAMVFHVSPGIVQVVYWGDLPAFAASKTMNFLSYQVVMHYYETGIKIIDIGPSTDNSIPNYGLCDFKESIGCMVYPKQSWVFNF